MAVRVPVAPALIRWAVDRSGNDPEELRGRFPQLTSWVEGVTFPTLRQLELFAKATYTPVGFFFLTTPPQEKLPLPDFRTIGDQSVERASANLLDTIYLCEQRQEWYREFARRNEFEAVPFVGGADPRMPAHEVAAWARDEFDFGESARGTSWSAALSVLTERAERAGVLVMISGVVGSNTHRVLDPEEFRGFAIADPLAPLIFVNGTDNKAAQIFTLAHELGHLRLGQSAVSKPELGLEVENLDERWCNEFAAELLVPLASVKAAHRPDRDLTEELDELALRFKVSTLVVLRRLYDAGLMTANEFYPAYRGERARVAEFAAQRPTSSGGSFYSTAPIRASKRFTRAIISDTLDGGTLHRDAFRLVGTSKPDTFEELGRQLGVA